jgi:SAM-dependent methyltransferase
MESDAGVIEHYSSGTLLQRILAGLRAQGLDPESFAPDELVPADQLHVGGAAAIQELADAAGINAQTRVLDLGSGIGGPARVWANRHGATVHGVDLTPEFVEAAIELTRRCGLSSRVGFALGSAAETGLPDEAFDIATMVHVGMNIADKQAVFTEAARVLKPGGAMAVYDVMVPDAADGGQAPDQAHAAVTGHAVDGGAAAALAYPLPWADTAADSFAAPVSDYKAALAAAGFGITAVHDRTAEGIDDFSRVAAASARAADEGSGPAPLGIHLVLGADAVARTGNLIAAFRRGLLAPTLIIARLGA